MLRRLLELFLSFSYYFSALVSVEMAAMEEMYKYTDQDVSRFMEVAIKLVKEAGDIITDAIARQKVVTQKESMDEKEKAEQSEGNASSILTETGT